MNDDPMSGPPPDEPVDPSAPLDPAQEAERDVRLRDLLRTASETDAVDPIGAIYAVRRAVRRRYLARGGVGGCIVAAIVAIAVIVPAGASSHRPKPLALPGTTVPTVLPPPTTIPSATAPPIRLTGALVSFGGCTDYLDYVRSRAQAEVGPYGLQSPEARSPGYAAGAPAAGFAEAGGAATPEAGPAASAPSSSPQVTPDYSQTNDQVAGVDEPDTVKTNGTLVLTLTGPTLRVLDTSARVLGSIELQGDTSGGFLLDGAYAVVLSSPSTAVSQPSPAFYSPYRRPQQAGPSVARAAVVDISDPTHPNLVRTFLFDGSLVASRLVGDQVRLVDRTDGPRLTFMDPSSGGDATSATAANRQLIAGSTLADWLPAWQSERPDGSVSARQPISACDAVSRARDATGISTVSVFVLDPTQGAPGPGTSVVAAGDIVYANADHLFVAGESEPTPAPQSGSVQYGCCTIVPPNGASTEIYEFDTPVAGQPAFVGSGSVPGWLLNSYAMDQGPNGLLRVATTEMTASGSTDAQISVLGPSGDRLVRVGSVGGLGQGEAIRAVRFIGEDAYVVTFRSFDPLYVVNLSNPAKPLLVGELDQPGFSEFLYPLPGNRLLGVGVEITNNEPSGLVVATYDVSNPAHPTRIDSSELVSGFQYGLQSYDPHAFLYWTPNDLALIAVPSANEPQSAAGVAAYHIGAKGNLGRAATLGHGTDLATRSLVIKGEVWVVTTAGVVTAALSALPASAWHPY